MEFKNVHSDDRREIFVNSDLLNGNEFSFIKLKKGKAIGGCIHNKDEYFLIVDGSVIVKTNNIKEKCGPGYSAIFRAGDAHMFHALEDSIVCEWGISAEEKENGPKDLNMLEEVNKVNGI